MVLKTRHGVPLDAHNGAVSRRSGIRIIAVRITWRKIVACPVGQNSGL